MFIPLTQPLSVAFSGSEKGKEMVLAAPVTNKYFLLYLKAPLDCVKILRLNLGYIDSIHFHHTVNTRSWCDKPSFRAA